MGELVPLFRDPAMTCPDCNGQEFYILLDKLNATYEHITKFECTNPDCSWYMDIVLTVEGEEVG